MNAIAKAAVPKIQKDRFTEDGTRMFNPTLPHGTIYSDGYHEGKFIQDYQGRAVIYKGDFSPLGYTGDVPEVRGLSEVQEENLELKDRIARLEKMMERMANAAKPDTAAPPPSTQTQPPAPTPEQLQSDKDRGAASPKVQQQGNPKPGK